VKIFGSPTLTSTGAMGSFTGITLFITGMNRLISCGARGSWPAL
jgi:hypothetical protein